MIRCVRLWSGKDGVSHFEEGVIDFHAAQKGDVVSGKFPVASASFQETDHDPKLGWHTDAVRQLVVTLSGTLTFTTADGDFTMRPGDVLFTEDTSGAGHDWVLSGIQGWRRLYLVLDRDTAVPFRRTAASFAAAGPPLG
jgi:hypothetical protein